MVPITANPNARGREGTLALHEKGHCFCILLSDGGQGRIWWYFPRAVAHRGEPNSELFMEPLCTCNVIPTPSTTYMSQAPVPVKPHVPYLGHVLMPSIGLA